MKPTFEINEIVNIDLNKTRITISGINSFSRLEVRDLIKEAFKDKEPEMGWVPNTKDMLFLGNLSARAWNTMMREFEGKPFYEMVEAIETGKALKLRNYGKKTHKEMIEWIKKLKEGKLK